jgi:hypothetical protein
MQPPLVIGWKERVDFTDWDIPRVRVKMDTGARTSAIDAMIHEVRANPDGTRIALLEVALYRRKPLKSRFVEALIVRTARVRNTAGALVERYVIETTIRLGPVTKRIQLSVANRGLMLSPVILGRKALANDFLVDASRKYVLNL